MFGTGVPVPFKGGERGIQQNLGQGISLSLFFFFFFTKIEARRRSRGGMLDGSKESP